jgi:hypothetical protein
VSNVSDSPKNRGPTQLELPLTRNAPLRVIQGGGQRVVEKLDSRDSVIRVLVEAGADVLLKRISPERAEAIQENVDRILSLFDRVSVAPDLMPVLKRELDQLQSLMSETRALRARKGK